MTVLRFLATLCPPVHHQIFGISRLPSTPRRHTVEVSASLGPQTDARIPINALLSVRPVDVHVQSVRPIVCVFFGCKKPVPLVLFVDLVVARLYCMLAYKHRIEYVSGRHAAKAQNLEI